MAYYLLPLVFILFATLPPHRLQYFIQGYNIILSYTTVLFPHFSYKVLGVLPRLVKDRLLRRNYQVPASNTSV